MNESETIKLIFDKYKNLMFTVTNSILNDEKLAEDAVQETFIKIIKNIKKINQIDCHKTKTFIVIMCRRTAIDIYRKHKKTNSNIISFDKLEYSLAEDLSFVKSEELTDVQRAIHSLPYIYCEVIMLKYIKDFTNKEIAEVLDIKESTVRKRVERGLKKLKDILTSEGWF